MKELKKLIKESFDLFVKKRWLKEIDKMFKSYKKYSDRASRDLYVMNTLIKRYNELYPEASLNVKAAEPVEPAKAKWMFWEGWMSNHDMRIEDATCSACGYKHHTVRRTYGVKETEQEVLNKLGNFCPNCGKPMVKNNN